MESPLFRWGSGDNPLPLSWHAVSFARLLVEPTRLVRRRWAASSRYDVVASGEKALHERSCSITAYVSPMHCHARRRRQLLPSLRRTDTVRHEAWRFCFYSRQTTCGVGKPVAHLAIAFPGAGTVGISFVVAESPVHIPLEVHSDGRRARTDHISLLVGVGYDGACAGAVAESAGDEGILRMSSVPSPNGRAEVLSTWLTDMPRPDRSTKFAWPRDRCGREAR